MFSILFKMNFRRTCNKSKLYSQNTIKCPLKPTSIIFFEIQYDPFIIRFMNVAMPTELHPHHNTVTTICNNTFHSINSTSSVESRHEFSWLRFTVIQSRHHYDMLIHFLF